jgi:predicted MFS family arabinose efflux permease
MDRFRLVILAYLAALLQALALALLAYTGSLTIGLLAVLSFLHGLIHSFSVPGAYGMMPRFVARERLSSAIAVNAAYMQLAVFAGPALAGWIILHFGTATAFATNVVGYLVWLVTALFLRTPASYVPPTPSGRSIAGDIADGARYIVGHKGISALLLLMLMGDALSSSVYQMLPAFADKVLGMGEGTGVAGMSSLLSAAGLGATAAALWLAHGGAAAATANRVLWAFLAFAVSVALLALSSHLLAALAVMLVFGVSGELRRTGTVSILQTAVSDEQRGRVMSTQFMFQRVAGGAGTLLVGSAAEQVGLRVPLLIAAALSVAAWGLAYANRKRIVAAFAPG